MTKLFDDKARQALLEKYVKPDLSKVTTKELLVKSISVKEARPYIASFHYSKTMPDSTRFCFGLFYKDEIVGVCTFGMGCGKNQYTSVISNIENGHYIELTRLWCEDTLGKNTESFFIGKSLSMLPKEIELVLSFSDEKQGHVGTIYQATNFYYLGKNNGGKMLVGKDGIEKHPRLLGIFRMRHPELKEKTNEELMEMLGYVYVKGGAKHKYAISRNRKTRKILEEMSIEYPKKQSQE